METPDAYRADRPTTRSGSPKLYGGTERVASYLTEALIGLGHDVTLFASGDSQTGAHLEPVWPHALRLDPGIGDAFAPQLLLEKVQRVAHTFDVLHFHLSYLPFPTFSQLDVPFVTTLHGRLDLPELQPVFDMLPQAPSFRFPVRSGCRCPARTGSTPSITACRKRC